MKSLTGGFPNYWPQASEAHSEFYDSAGKLVDQANELFSIQVEAGKQTLFRWLAMSSVNSLRAAACLGMNGFGVDANAISRSIFERAVTMRYLNKHPEKFEDYMEYGHVVVAKRLKSLEELAPQQFGQIDPEIVRTKRDLAKKAQDKRRKKGIKEDRNWHGENLRALAKAARIEAHYRAYYSWASSIHHTDASGLAHHMDGEREFLASPHPGLVREALHAAHSACILCLQSYAEAIGVAENPQLRMLVDDLNRVWGAKTAAPKP